MGLFSSRQMPGRDADQDPDTNSAAAASSSVSDANGYRYPPREGRYFGSYFVLGGVRFDSLLPDAFLFGDNSELNFVGSSPVSLPYVLPPRSLPCRTLRALVNIRRDSVRLVRCPPATATASNSAPAAPSPLHSPLSTPPPPATIQAPPAVCFAPQADPCALCCRCATPPSNSHTAADTYNLEFTFDADVACSITVHYVCSELAGKRGPVYRSQLPTLASPVYRYPAGAGQRFSQPEHVLLPALLAARCGIGVAAPTAASDDTNLHQQQQQQLLPVVIECRAEELSSSLADSAAAAGMAPSSSASHQCHYTIGFIDAAVASSSSVATTVPMAGAVSAVADDRSVAVESERSLSAECRCGATVAPSVGVPVNYQLKPIKQKLFVDGLTYLLQEVYGIENKRAPAPPPAHDSAAAVTEIRPPTATTTAAVAVRLNSASAGSQESQDVGRRVKGGASASDTSDGALGDSDSEPVPDQNADPDADVEHVDCDNGYEDGDEEDVGDGEDVEDEEEDTGAECVICMSETRSTLILPCRHLCVCSVCASHLRYQANNCPICRAPFRALLNLQVVLPYADCDDSGDRRRLHHHQQQQQQQQRPQRRRPPRARHQAGVCQEQEAEDEETSHGVSDREQEQADFDEEDPAVSGGSRGLNLVSVLNGPLRNVLDPGYGPDPGRRRSRRSRRRRSRVRTAVRRSRHTPDVNRPFGHGLSFCRAGSDGNSSSNNNNSSRSGRGADDTVSTGAGAASLMMDATGGGGGGSSGGGGDDSGSCGAATLLGSTVGLVDCRSLAARDERALRSRTPSREKTQQPPLLPPQQQSSHHHHHLHHHHQQQQQQEDEDDDDDDVGFELCSR